MKKLLWMLYSLVFILNVADIVTTHIGLTFYPLEIQESNQHLIRAWSRIGYTLTMMFKVGWTGVIGLIIMVGLSTGDPSFARKEIKIYSGIMLLLVSYYFYTVITNIQAILQASR